MPPPPLPKTIPEKGSIFSRSYTVKTKLTRTFDSEVITSLSVIGRRLLKNSEVIGLRRKEEESSSSRKLMPSSACINFSKFELGIRVSRGI